MRVFKNLNKGALAVLVAIAFFSISWTEIKNNKQSGQWYEVSLIDENGDPTEATNQKIEGLYPGGEPTSPCENQNEPIVCAVFLDLGSNPMPTTIAQANALSIDTSVRYHRPE